MRIINADDLDVLEIARVGERDAAQVIFDTAAWCATYGAGGRFELEVERPTDAQPYLVALTATEDAVAWTVSEADTAVLGRGRCQLSYYVGSTLAKTRIWSTRILASLSEPGDPPPEPWESYIEQVHGYAQAAEQAQEAAEAAAGQAAADAGTAAAAAEAAAASEQAAAAHETSASASAQSADAAAAGAAQSAANAQAAETAAETAQTAAETAQTGAESAQEAAEAAQTAAETAQTGAESAQEAAEAAQAAAEDAQEAAEAAAASIDPDELNRRIFASFPHAVVSGAVASFADGADGIPVRSLTAQIVPVQSGSGDPSPTNVRPISGWTEAEVHVTGANVWDEETERGTISATGVDTASTTSVRSKNHTDVKPGTSYFLVVPSGVSVRWCAYRADGSFIQRSNAITAPAVITTQADCATIRLVIGEATYANDVSLNYPATDTAYHAYNGKAYSVAFPASAGTVYRGSLRDNGDNTWTLKSKPYYANYNGEALVGPWVSSMDVYAEGVTPTTGAQVVDLGGVETEHTISAESVKTLLGNNNIFVDCGDVEVDYRADPTLYIGGKIASLQALILDN